MSEDTKTLPEAMEAPKAPPPLPDDVWRDWYPLMRCAVDDMESVLADQVRRKRKRDLGPREAKRLYEEASKTLASLFAHAERGDGAPLR